jgi:lysophospholipase L1-like esterase
LGSILETVYPQPIDVVVLSIGVNDVTNLMSPDSWVQWQTRLAKGILSRHSPKLLIHSALPPMHGFTALPQPLRWFLGNWAKEMNRRLERSLEGEARRFFRWPVHSVVSDGLATDGFHPGPLGYTAWATGLHEMIAEVNFVP